MEENCWDHLGIEPTADTAAIKKAYAKQLKFNKPDKNPEGFRELRAAYERALDESYWYIEEEDEYEYEDQDEADKESDTFSDSVSFTTADTPPALSKSSENTTDTDSKNALMEEVIDWRHEDTATDGSDANHSNEVYETGNAYDDHVEDDRDSALDSDDTGADFVLFDHSIWRDEWAQAVREEDAIIDGGDGRLLALIQSQIDMPRPLDEQNDLEETLLSWFDDQPPLFPRSYQWAKEHFNWEARLKHWSYNYYPWYMIESLNRRYQQVSYFQLPTAFRKFLLLRFPIVARFWPAPHLSDDNEKEDKIPSSEDEHHVEPIKRLDVFKSLFFPMHVGELAYELDALDQELTYYRQDAMVQHDDELTHTGSRSFDARYWQQESPLKTLNDWVFKRFIEFEDFGVIAMATVVVLGAVSFMFDLSWQDTYQDVFGVFLAISLYYLFWQLMLRLFTTPNTFVMRQPQVAGWRNASIGLFIMGYVTWMDVASLDPIAVFTSPVYYLTHIAGASLFIACSLRSSIFFLKAVSWYAGILLLIVAVVVPLLVMTTAPTLPKVIGMSPMTPLFWLGLAVPISFFNLSEAYPQLAWLANVGNFFVKIWMFSMMGGVIMLFAYCVDMLPKINFGFTATAIILIAVIMVIGLAKIINANVDED